MCSQGVGGSAEVATYKSTRLAADLLKVTITYLTGMMRQAWHTTRDSGGIEIMRTYECRMYSRAATQERHFEKAREDSRHTTQLVQVYDNNVH